jgi:hypothetical protein
MFVRAEPCPLLSALFPCARLREGCLGLLDPYAWSVRRVCVRGVVIACSGGMLIVPVCVGRAGVPARHGRLCHLVVGDARVEPKMREQSK